MDVGEEDGDGIDFFPEREGRDSSWVDKARATHESQEKAELIERGSAAIIIDDPPNNGTPVRRRATRTTTCPPLRKWIAFLSVSILVGMLVAVAPIAVVLMRLRVDKADESAYFVGRMHGYEYVRRVESSAGWLALPQSVSAPAASESAEECRGGVGQGGSYVPMRRPGG